MEHLGEVCASFNASLLALHITYSWYCFVKGMWKAAFVFLEGCGGRLATQAT